uniref:Aspartic proteinase n=1 Tax=Colletotrichum fructicola (strain Nara gc5) TaxID=1213859 RepID=L2G011_COLFN
MTVKTMLLSLIQLGCFATATPAPPAAAAAVPPRGRSLTIPVRANPHHVPDGPAELAAAYRRWDVPVPEGLETHLLARRAGYSGKFSSLPPPTANNDAWLSEIYLGTPDAQPVSVRIDSSVSDFWLFSTDTQFPKSIATASRPNLYDPSKSRASQELSDFSWNLTDDDTSSVSGKVYFDNLRIGGLTDQNWFNITNATIQSAVDVTGHFAVDQTGLGGVLGIAKSGPSAVQPAMPTMMDRLKQDLHYPSICADLRHNSSLGFFDFGSGRSGDSTTLVDEPPVPGSPHWDFKVARFRLTSMADGVWWSAPFSATVDTGSNLLLIPGQLVALYYAEIPGATFDPSLRAWLFPCNIASGIPDFEFATSGGFNGTLPKEYINLGPVSSNDGKCFGGIQPSGNDHGIFGGVVLKTMYVQFNFGDTGSFVSFGPKGLDVCSLTNTCKL